MRPTAITWKAPRSIRSKGLKRSCSIWRRPATSRAASSRSASRSRVAIDMAEEAFKRDSQVTGVTTGLIDLDRKLGGLHPSDLLILAGRPSMGKTALATNIAFAAAKAHMRTNGSEGAGVAFFSLEMSAEQLATRILADEAQVASEKIRRGDLKPEDFQRFSEASSILSRVPFYVDDTPALSIAAVRTRARRLARTSRQSGPDRGRLSPIAARHGRQEQRKPGAGSLRDHPRAEGHRQGTGCAGRGAVPAFPRGRTARRQAAPAFRPSRIRARSSRTPTS